MKSLKVFLFVFILFYSELSAFDNKNYLNCNLIYYRHLKCSGVNSSEILRNDFLNYFNESVEIFVESISINNGQINTITYDWTQGLPINSSNWKTVDLSFNRLTKLKVGAFTTLLSLNKINLNNNQLISLPVGLFDKNLNLTWINLSGNNLTTLKVGMFNKLKELRYLHLHHNKLVSLPMGIFNETNQLLFLFLSNNKLSHFEDDFFNATPLLQRLDLSYNRIFKLESGIFNGLDKLYNLLLNNCKLTKISEDLLNGLISLRILNLSNNFITKIPKKFFTNTTCVIDNLDLSKNYIDSFPTNTVCQLFNFGIVDLKQNRLKKVPLYNNQIRIERLNLKRNVISNIRLSDIAQINYLKSLNIGNNKLTFLRTKVIKEFSNVTMLYLEGNPWQCPCWKKIQPSREKFAWDFNYKSRSAEVPICFDVEKISKCIKNNKIKTYPAYKDYVKILTQNFRTRDWWY